MHSTRHHHSSTAAAPPCARISCCSPATQHISTSAHYPSTPAIVCHHSWHHEEWYCTRTCSFGTLFYYMACTPAPRTFSAAHSLHPGTVLYIYLLQTHTVRREGSRPRIIAMRFALHNGGPWRRSLRATRVTRIPIRKAGARTLTLTIAAPAIVRGAGGGLACTCQASQERFSDAACEPPTWFCTIFSRQGRTSGLRLRGEGETTSARGLCFFHLPRRSDRGPRGEKPHRAAENAPGQWLLQVKNRGASKCCRTQD